MNSRPGVTVVVPVYGDLESLSACVEALKTTVDFSRHAVMLVNDVGPDADEIEAALLEAIDGLDGFEYHRNARNLGFVGTCNRAALELDRSDRDILLLNSD
ncbi:MAG: glycosyltransferase family 2 protein, partial [Humibacter sp.]